MFVFWPSFYLEMHSSWNNLFIAFHHFWKWRWSFCSSPLPPFPPVAAMTGDLNQHYCKSQVLPFNFLHVIYMQWNKIVLCSALHNTVDKADSAAQRQRSAVNHSKEHRTTQESVWGFKLYRPQRCEGSGAGLISYLRHKPICGSHLSGSDSFLSSALS